MDVICSYFHHTFRQWLLTLSSLDRGVLFWYPLVPTYYTLSAKTQPQLLTGLILSFTRRESQSRILNPLGITMSKIFQEEDYSLLFYCSIAQWGSIRFNNVRRLMAHWERSGREWYHRKRSGVVFDCLLPKSFAIFDDVFDSSPHCFRCFLSSVHCWQLEIFVPMAVMEVK